MKNIMRSMLAVIAAAAMLMTGCGSSSPQAETNSEDLLERVDNGSITGENEDGKDVSLDWTLYGKGILILEGNGRIKDYASDGADKSPYNGGEKIEKLIIADSISYVGNNAFCKCPKLKLASMTELKFKEIGKGSFANCPELKSVHLYECLEKIGERAFYGCKKLKNCGLEYKYNRLPADLKYIGKSAFENCDLKQLTFPYGNVEIAEDAFKGCKDLVIRCRKGTKVEQYAKQNGIKTEDLPEDVARIFSHDTPSVQN